MSVSAPSVSSNLADKISPVVVPFRMFDLDFGVRTRHLDPVITLFHVRRKIGKQELPIQQDVQIAKERFEADRCDRSLEKRPAAGFVRKFLQRALPVENKPGISVLDLTRRRVN